MINWLNLNSGSVMALLTVVYVICTLILCVMAKRSNSLARRLHEDIHRPVVVCDFFVENTCVYFRVKNVGQQPATDIRIAADGPPPWLLGSWEEHPIIKNGLCFLAPGSQQVSIFCLPKHTDKFSTIRFDVKYQDSSERTFADSYETNLAAWLKEDLARQNNSPLVKVIERVAIAIEKNAQS